MSLTITCWFTCDPGTYCLIMVQSSKNQLCGWCIATTWHSSHLFCPLPPQSNGKLEVFHETHKYLKPTFKMLCENDLDNWDQYLNQVLTSYCITPHLATGETALFLVYGRDPNLPLCQLLELMQHFLGDPDSGHLDLEMHHLALAIAKKTLDENRFRSAHKTTDWTAPNLQIGDRVYFKKQATWKMGSEVASWILDCPHRVWWILPSHWKWSLRKDQIL